PRREHVGVRISRDDIRAQRRKAFDDAEKGAVDVEAVRLRGHAVPERVRRVDLYAENRAGGEMLLARQAAFEVAHWNGQAIDDEIAGVAHGDERAALGDELLQA